MISVRNITKYYGDTLAVDQVSFDVAVGDTLVLLGTSGSGKTTMLKMLNRLIEPTSGQIFINGEDVLQQDPKVLRRGIGYVIQHQGLFPHYTVAENIGIVPRLLKWPQQKADEQARKLLSLLDLAPDEYLHRYPDELSGGQQQRVSIARALAADPPVMLMDEPFGALDPITRTQIQQEFINLEELLEKTIVLVTHDVFEAIELGDKICLMDGGQVQQQGTPEELIFRPANDFVREFFNASRFQFELKALYLSDILPYAVSTGQAIEKTLSLPEKADLLQCMEELSRTGSDAVQVTDKAGAVVTTLTRDEILNSVKVYKKAFADL